MRLCDRTQRHSRADRTEHATSSGLFCCRQPFECEFARTARSRFDGGWDTLIERFAAETA